VPVGDHDAVERAFTALVGFYGLVYGLTDGDCVLADYERFGAVPDVADEVKKASFCCRPLRVL